MILGYDDLKRELAQRPFEKETLISNFLSVNNITEETIRENGIDCRIGNTIAIDTFIPGLVIDTHDAESSDLRFVKHTFEESIIIPPMSNILLVTEEDFGFDNKHMAFCGLRSSVARYGFVAPITIVDAGFEGTLTIECWYGGKNAIRIWRGDRFLHVIVAEIKTPVSKPYKGVYLGQTKVRTPKAIN